MNNKPKIQNNIPDSNNMMEWALFYASLGIPVFAIKPKTKTKFYADYKHLGSPSKNFPSGNPYSWSAQATTDPEWIRKIWTEYPDANIGGVTGQGLYVIDRDERENGSGSATIDKWEREGVLPDKLNKKTWTSITGSGSRQFFYFLNSQLVKRAKDKRIKLSGDSDLIEVGSHVDTRGDGNYVLLPPSIHPNGNRYQWDGDKAPCMSDIADFDRTVEYIFTHKSNKQKRAKNKLKRGTTEGLIPKGSRRSYLLQKAGEIVNKMIDITNDSAIVSMLMEIARTDLDLSEPLGTGWDGLQADMEKVVSDLRSAIEKEREEGNNTDWKYCMRAWHLEHPDEDLPDPIDWDVIRQSGERRKKNELIIPGEKTTQKEKGKTEIGIPENIRSELETTKEGKIKNTPSNIELIIANDQELKDMFVLNLFNDQIEVLHSWYERYTPYFSDDDATQIKIYLSKVYGLTVRIDSDIYKTIRAIAPKYHPIIDELESLEWDGTERLDELFPKYLGAEKTQFNTEVTRLLFMGMIHRVFHSGCKFDYMVIFHEKKQGLGKSSLARFLALRDEWFTDCLDDINKNDEAVRIMLGAWIVEFGEMLGAMSVKYLEKLKSFISRTDDKITMKYDKFSTIYPRHSVFIGTSNRTHFLPDDKSGNRRFIPIICHAEKQKEHPLDNEAETREYIRQCYAEAMTIYNKCNRNPKLTLDRKFEDELIEIQKGYESLDERIGIIQQWLDDNRAVNTVCITMLWVSALGRDKSNMTRKEQSEIAEILDNKITGWKRHISNSQQRRFPNYGVQIAWDRVSFISKEQNDINDIKNDNVTQ